MVTTREKMVKPMISRSSLPMVFELMVGKRAVVEIQFLFGHTRFCYMSWQRSLAELEIL